MVDILLIFRYRYVHRVCMAVVLCNGMITAVIVLTELLMCCALCIYSYSYNKQLVNFQKYFFSSLDICLYTTADECTKKLRC